MSSEGGVCLAEADRVLRHGHRSPENFRDALREVWLSPSRFFRHLDPEGGALRPVIFAALVLYLNLLLNTLLQVAWTREVAPVLILVPTAGLVFSVVLAPLLVAALTALVLTVLDGTPSRAKFGPLFRALGYATGTGFVFWVPYAALIAIPYGAYVATVALKATLGLNWQRAAVGALVPLGAALLIIFILAGPDDAYRILLNPPQE